MNPHRIAIIAAAVSMALALPRLRADDSYTGSNGNWSDPTVWSNNLPPTSLHNVFVTPALPSGIINTLTLDTPATVAFLTLGHARPRTRFTRPPPLSSSHRRAAKIDKSEPIIPLPYPQ
jgi:hypothetical protein